jgi:hypothetical protein
MMFCKSSLFYFVFGDLIIAEQRQLSPDGINTPTWFRKYTRKKQISCTDFLSNNFVEARIR